MRLAAAGELTLLDQLKRGFREKSRDLVLGIGDDCAVIRPADENMLLTTDMMVEGVHFDLRWTTPYQLGFKLVSVNVSDIYAMGGRPRFMLLDFAADKTFEMKDFKRLFDGVRAGLKKYGVSLVGGDISSAGKLVLSATLVGYASRPVTRSGARPGDLIYVTGSPGDSACGLMLLKKMKKRIEIERRANPDIKPDAGLVATLGWKTVLPLVKRHLMPSAVRPDRYAEAATAMIDISDGLLMDLSRICKASGTGARIYAENIPVSPEMRRAAAYLKTDPLEPALSGGEDYELLFTAPEGKFLGATCIGEITARGMQLVDAAGKRKNIGPRGYQHFSA